MEIEKSYGLLGIGYWGKNILRNLYEMRALHSACDKSPSALESFRAQCPDAEFMPEPEKVIENPDVKAVIIATPAPAHHALAKKALLAGKDVFVEKPLALSVRDGAELVEIAAKNGRVLMVGHILRYHPGFAKLRELATSGALGAVNYIYSNRLSLGRFRTEEDIWWSFAPHDISAMLALAGREPSGISSFGAQFLTKGVADTFVTSMDFGDGLKGHVFVSWLNPFKEQKLVVAGSRGMAVFEDSAPAERKLLLYPHRISVENGRPDAVKGEPEPVPFEKAEPLRLELAHFIQCVETRQCPVTDGEEGLRVLRVLEAAARYSGNGKNGRNNADGPSAAGETLKSAEARPEYKPQTENVPFIDATARMDENSAIGSNTRIWHFSHVLSGCSIGRDCVIGQNVMIGPDVTIGNGCKIQNNVSLYKGVRLEDGVFCGPSCVFTNVYNPRAFVNRKSEFLETLVKKGATIGANATIVCGTTIGEYALIGAGAVVKKDVPPYALMVGVPARRAGWVCKCGKTLKSRQACSGGPGPETFEKILARCSCGNLYLVSEDKLTPLEENQ